MNDHFSQQASIYAKARPHYPSKLFSWLSGITKNHDLAWDCGTGNGQAAAGLSPYFKHIIATDGSAEQLKNAIPLENVVYRQATAENSGLDAASVDLITAATAAHWFDLPAFYNEVVHVGKRDAVLALWTYGHSSVFPELDEMYNDYTFGLLKDYWPKGREHIDTAYRDLYFPFEELQHEDFFIALEWTFDQYMDYLRSWSGKQAYLQKNGIDPTEFIYDGWKKVWGPQARTVYWPIYLKAAFLNSFKSE